MVVVQVLSACAPNAKHQVAVQKVIGGLHKDGIAPVAGIGEDVCDVVNLVAEYGVITPAIQPYPLR